MTTAKATLQQNSQAKAVLQAYHALTERTYKGDVDAIVALVDLANAVERAGLTARQAQALALVYGADMTQAAAGKALGIAQNTVAGSVKGAIDKIEAVYAMWREKEALI